MRAFPEEFRRDVAEIARNSRVPRRESLRILAFPRRRYRTGLELTRLRTEPVTVSREIKWIDVTPFFRPE